MDKTEALELALKVLRRVNDTDDVDDAIATIKEALAKPECNPHPNAPHGFDRNSSHSEDRYVCECESWTPPEQEPVGRFSKFTDGIWREVTAGSPGVLLYEAPPQHKPLSEDKILGFADSTFYEGGKNYEILAFAKAIEKAHNIKE